MIEFLVVTPIIILTLTYTLFSLAWGLEQIITKHLALDAIICLEKAKPLQLCQKELSHLLKQFIPWSNAVIQIKNSSKKYLVNYHWQYSLPIWRSKKIDLRRTYKLDRQGIYKPHQELH